MKEIDVSQVPAEKMTDPRFLHLKSQMEGALANEQWVTAFCVHEAAHIIYFTRAGLKDFTFRSATILYDATHDDFEGFPASVRPGGISDELMAKITGTEFISAIAIGHAAGGAATRKLTNVPDVGYESDYENLSSLCDVIQSRYADWVVDRKGLWKAAEQAVEKDLRRPAARTEIWNKVKEIRPLLFGV